MAREAFKNTCKDSDLIDIRWGPKHSIFYKPSWGTYYVAIFENHWPGYINYTLEFTKTYRYYRWRTEEVSETGVVIFKNSENVDSRNYRTTNLTLFLNILWNKCSLSTYEKRKVMTAWKQHRFPKDKLWKTHRVCVCVCVCGRSNSLVKKNNNLTPWWFQLPSASPLFLKRKTQNCMHKSRAKE